jgi:hypothetical protein
MSYISFPAVETLGSVGNLGKNLNDSIVVENKRGYPTIAFHCNVPTGGEVTFEGSFDKQENWEAVNVRSITDDIYTNKTDNGSSFIGSVSGMTHFRFRTSVAGSENGTVKGALQRDVSIIEGIEFGYPPHRFGFIPVHKDVTFTSAQSSTSIWTPEVGKKFVLTDLLIICGGVTDANVAIFDETNTQGNRAFNAPVDVSNNKQYSLSQQLKTPYIGKAINNSLKLTTSANISINVVTHGYEV